MLSWQWFDLQVTDYLLSISYISSVIICDDISVFFPICMF